MNLDLNLFIILSLYYFYISMDKRSIEADSTQETNYKQISKLKHLSEEHAHLKSLVNILEQINHRSRVILKGIQQKTKKAHLNSTACSIGLNAAEPTLVDQDVEDIEELVTSLDLEINSKKNYFEKQAIRQEKSKIQDQILFRKMLYEYENKLSNIKSEIKTREECIQRAEKAQKQGKVAQVQQKILGSYFSSFQLFNEMCFIKEQMKNSALQTSQIQEKIQNSKEQIKRLECVILKLKVAKKAKMPFYKFKNFVKNGIYYMENQDVDDYSAFMSFGNQEVELTRPMKSRVASDNQITPEMLYLLIRKEEMNKEILQKLIRQEDQKQEELQVRNQTLKQAILMKESQQHFNQMQKAISECKTKFKIENQQRLSEGGEQNHPSKKKCQQKLSSSDYHIYLQKLGAKVDDLMSGYLCSVPKKIMKKSKSQRWIVGRGQEQQPQGMVTAKFMSEDSLFDKYNSIITDRFYGEAAQYEYV